MEIIKNVNEQIHFEQIQLSARQMQRDDSQSHTLAQAIKKPKDRNHPRNGEWNVLFSMLSIQRGVSKTRAAGGLNAMHIRFVLEAADLPTDGNITELRARLHENLGRCLRPWTPWHRYPRTDWLEYRAAHHAAGFK
jgi:hypothetical protein